MSGCSAAIPLKKADEKINGMAYSMADYCFNSEMKGTDITPTILEWKDFLDEVYQGSLEPQTSNGLYKLMDEGLGLDPYPTGADVAGATVGAALEASLSEFITALLWPDWLQVFADPKRYNVYEREYTLGDRDNFLAGDENYLETHNYQEDIGQMGVSFAYYTDMNFERFLPDKNAEFPSSGVLLVCNKMDGEATNISGSYNARMTALYSFTIYYPISDTVAYRINGTWIKAWGGLAFFSAGANSGNVGQGILDEQESLMNWIVSQR